MGKLILFFLQITVDIVDKNSSILVNLRGVKIKIAKKLSKVF